LRAHPDFQALRSLFNLVCCPALGGVDEAFVVLLRKFRVNRQVERFSAQSIRARQLQCEFHMLAPPRLCLDVSLELLRGEDLIK
jgi:hypothetical protein